MWNLSRFSILIVNIQVFLFDYNNSWFFLYVRNVRRCMNADYLF